MRHVILLAAAIVQASAAGAEDVRLCGARTSVASADGRLLNHFPYPVAGQADLVRPPRTLVGQCAAVHRDMRADLEALLARAQADPQVRGQIVAVSCYRSRQHQSRIFCRNGGSTELLVQAYQVAPPGFSEHATGMAIDFGERRGRCKLVGCFARTAVGRWLAKNAPDFGFELSFPEGNAQGVAFEPWHWRWVGRGGDQQQSLFARSVFAAARERFAARRESDSRSARSAIIQTSVAVAPPAGASPATLGAATASRRPEIDLIPVGFRSGPSTLAEP